MSLMPTINPKNRIQKKTFPKIKFANASASFFVILNLIEKVSKKSFIDPPSPPPPKKFGLVFPYVPKENIRPHDAARKVVQPR